MLTFEWFRDKMRDIHFWRFSFYKWKQKILTIPFTKSYKNVDTKDNQGCKII